MCACVCSNGLAHLAKVDASLFARRFRWRAALDLARADDIVRSGCDRREVVTKLLRALSRVWRCAQSARRAFISRSED
jgi:hypothetical protein